jgi:ATP-dependent DNA ligase
MKEDYIHPIRQYYRFKRYGDINKTPDHMNLVLSLKSPMLAKRIDALKPELQKEIWGSDKWYLEDKLNGARTLIVKTDEGMFLYSRHNSEIDLLPIEFSQKILYPENFNLDIIKDNFILDCEITSDTNKLNTIVGKYGVLTETMLQAVTAILNCDDKKARLIQKQENIRFTFNIFDCLYYNGSWTINEPLYKRRRLAFELWGKLQTAGFKIYPVRSNRSNKELFYKKIIMTGGEGCVAKQIDGLYVPDTNRGTYGWIKIKRSVKEMSGMVQKGIDDVFASDTIDGWISGFELGNIGKNYENMIGCIKVSLYLNKKDGSRIEHEIARISGLDLKLRQDMTEIVDGIPTLKASYYNRIVEIDGAGVSPRERRLNHAVLLGFRYDKNRDSCFMDEEFLEKMIL